MTNRSNRQLQPNGNAPSTGRRNSELSETKTMAEVAIKQIKRRPLHVESETSHGGLPWRGNNGTKKVIYTMREVDSSESPPPPPPPTRIPLTLLTGGSAANNATRHLISEEQDDKTEHTLKSVHDLVHKFETKIRNASSSTKKHHGVPTSSTNTIAKAARSQSPPKKYHYYKGSSDETSEISDDDEDCVADDITALSVSEKTKFFEHLSTRNSSPAHGDYICNDSKLAGAPHFQAKFIHAALRSQLLRSSSTGTLGKIPPLQQHILSLQVLNKSNNIVPSKLSTPEGVNRSAVATPHNDSHCLPQPLQLNRQTSALTRSSVVVDIHSPLKSQLRKNHYERIYKRSKRQLQHQNGAAPLDDDISSLTVPSFPEKKDSRSDRQPKLTNNYNNKMERNNSHQNHWALSIGCADSNSPSNAEVCDPYPSGPLEHKKENLQQQQRQNYYELIAYAESLRDMPVNRSKKELSSAKFSENSAHNYQEHKVSQVDKNASAMTSPMHVSPHSSRAPLVELHYSKSDQCTEKIVEECILEAPHSGGGGPIESEGMQKGKKIGVLEEIRANHLNKNSLTEMTLDQQGETKHSELHDVSNLHLLSEEIPQRGENVEDGSPSGKKSSSLQQNEKEGDQNSTTAPSAEKSNSNYFTPPICSRKALFVVPTSDFPTDKIDNGHSDMRLQCPESPAPSDEAAANDSNNGDAPSDEKQMPRLSKFIPHQRITNPVFSSLKENIPVPKITVAAGRKKRFSEKEEPKKSVEKGNSARKRREYKVICAVPSASTANTKRPLRSVPVTPVEPSIRSRVQTLIEKRHEVPRQHAGLPPRKPNSITSSDNHSPLTRKLNLKIDKSDAVLCSTPQGPKLLEKETQEFSDEKRINSTQEPLQTSPISSQTNPLAFEDAKTDVKTELINPSKTGVNKKKNSDVETGEKKLSAENSLSTLQSVRKDLTKNPSKAIDDNYKLKPSDEAEHATHDERGSKSEKQFTFDDDDEELCSITMRITRDAKVGPQVGVSISEYGTGSVEVSRLDTPTIQKVANLVLRGNLGKKENERSHVKIGDSTVPGKVSQSQNTNLERRSDPIGSQALEQKANPSFLKKSNGTKDKTVDASEYMESTVPSGSYLSRKKSLDSKSDVESRPWRKPGQIPGKKSIGGISAVSVCSHPSSDRELLGSLKPDPSFNECGIDVTQTNISQDYEKRGFFQGNAKKKSFDDGSWTIFSGNDSFTLNTSTSGSAIPPPPPKVPHPSQLGSEAHILQGCYPENRGPRPVSLSPQPSISSTSVSDFTLSHMRQTYQSPKMDRSRCVSRSPQTIISSPPPPPPSVAHPRQCSDTYDEAPKTGHTLPDVERNVLRSVSRPPQPIASSTMSSDFTVRRMRKLSLSPKNTVLRSDLCSSQLSPSRTETFDPFDLRAQTGITSQSPKGSRQRSVSRSSLRHQMHQDKFDLFTEHQDTWQVSQSPTNSGHRSVSRSSHRKLLNTDDFDPVKNQRHARRASQSPTNLKLPSFSVSSQSSASLREPLEWFVFDRDKSISPPRFSKNGAEITSRSVSRSPEPSVHQISSDGCIKSSRAVSRSPDARIIQHFQGLRAQSSQASVSSSTNDDSFPLRRMVSHSPQPGSISSSATSDTFTLRNMRSASSSPTPSIPRLDLSREENNVIRMILTEPKLSRRSRQLSMSPEKSIPSSDASLHPSCPSPLRLSPAVVSAFENIELELGGEVSKGTGRKVTFDNHVKVRAFVNDSVMSPLQESGKQSTQTVVKRSKVLKWTSSICGCLRPPPRSLGDIIH